MKQLLYLVGYDISDPKRQALLRYHVKSYSATGQKSAYECMLSLDNKQQLTEFALSKTHPGDAFFIIKTRRTYWSQVVKGDLSKSEDSATHHFYIG
ncbi:CRISPR-associated endonuclease Cas2 [Psychrobacter luti]|uniref:CRISPR-associated endonuclease Cas2 n=1 Tax=Psychrobacter luti TaxID=198481 RepID=A0A839TDL7_9GAMM|nr:CRISPR-associated endonuclease Cas2 [Psychrobacter luti]MBB3106135.1 CRISPR-associated endonuclease Cas2 [Psychrobacter luti]